MEDIKTVVDEVLAETESSLLSLVGETTTELLEALNSYKDNARDRFSSLLGYMSVGGDITFLKDRLLDEVSILKSELLSFEVIGKQTAQTLINSVQGILIAAVFKVLPDSTQFS